MSECLLQVEKFEQLSALLSGADNKTDGISNLELQHLSWLGSQVPENGAVVEIGTHRGKSICAMALGVMHAGRENVKLFGVDLWQEGAGKTFAHYNSSETWKIFQRQITAMGVAEIIKPVVGNSVKMSKKRSKPINLLFIDAGHKYKDVLADWKAWSPFVPVGGVVAFHDYGTRFPGVDQVIREEVLGSGKYLHLDTVHRVWSGMRVG